MAITIPNAASTYTACAVIPNSANRWVMLGFTATPGGSGSAMFLAGSAIATASPLLPIVVPTNGIFQSDIFNSPQGIVAASIAGGSAFIWLKTAS